LINFREKDNVLIFTVRVSARASKSEIVGCYDGALKVRLTRPPVRNAANEELIKLLVRELGAAKSDVEIISGHTSKIKQIRVGHSSKEKLTRILQGKK
jgi:uncharacterized protein (TIGR00251 family)